MNIQEATDARFENLKRYMKEMGITNLNVYPVSYSRVKLLIGNSDIVLTYDQLMDIINNDREVHEYTVRKYGQYRLGS